MCFLVLTSQSPGNPFMFETMFRSGVPPHIGQSPVPGSDASTNTGAVAARATAARKHNTRFMITSFIGSKFQIVDIGAELRVDEEARGALSVADGIGLVDLPGRGLCVAGRPRFAA